jgi:hypothetical protein
MASNPSVPKMPPLPQPVPGENLFRWVVRNAPLVREQRNAVMQVARLANREV